jgi:PAS domain S-box-containing protein
MQERFTAEGQFEPIPVYNDKERATASRCAAQSFPHRWETWGIIAVECTKERLDKAPLLSSKEPMSYTEFGAQDVLAMAGDSCPECQVRLLANLIHSTPDFVAVRGMDGVLVYMNPAGKRMLGLPIDAPLDHLSTRELCPAWVYERTRAEWLPTVLENGTTSGEAALLAPDGTEIPVSFTMVIQRDREGNPAFLSTIARDISAQRAAEIALARRAREQAALYEFTDRLQRAETLQEVYESAIVSILSALECDRASILMFDDAGVMKFVGDHGLSDVYKRAVEGHSPWTRDTRDPDPVSLDDIESSDLDDDLKTVIRLEGIRSLVFVPLVEDGKLIGKFMVYFDAPHTYGTEEINLAQAIGRQLSFAVERRRLDQERRRAEAQLRRMALELEEKVRTRTEDLEGFAYHIAHDMRQHIRGVNANAQMIAQDAKHLLPEDARQDLERLVLAARRMGKLTDDILTNARIGVRELSSEVVDLSSIAERIAQDLVQRSHCNENTRFSIQPDLKAKGDPAMLGLLLENLLDNACKYSSSVANPEVKFGRDEISFFVGDNGIGFAPEFSQKIFNAFERLDTRYEGTGIGLANVKRIIERHGGSVWAQSAPNEGATIRFTLGSGVDPAQEVRSLVAAL